VVAKVRKKLALHKQIGQKFDRERFNLRKLNELEGRKRYPIKISIGLADLENLNDSENINRAWKNVKENIKTSVKEILGQYELEQHKPWFDEEYLQFSDERKLAKL